MKIKSKILILLIAIALIASSVYSEAAVLNIVSADNGRAEDNDSGEPDDKTDMEPDKELEDKPYLTEKDVEKAVIAFDKETYNVIVNNSINIKAKSNIPDKFLRVTFASQDGYSYVNNGGNMTAYVSGNYSGVSVVKVTALIDYCDDEGMYAGCKTITADCSINILGYVDKKLIESEQFTLDYRQYDEFSDMGYEISDISVATVSDTGVVTAIKEGETSVYITDGTGRRIYIGSVTVKSNNIRMAENSISRAIGSAPYQLSVVNAAGNNILWSSDNNLVATVDQTGFVTPHAVGETVIKAVHTSETGFKTTCTCYVSVTSPVLSVTSCNVAKDNSILLTVNGTKGKADWSSSKEKIASVSFDNYSYEDYSYEDYSYDIPGYGNASGQDTASQPEARVYGNKKGKCVISVSVDGITLTCNICVTDPKLKKDFFVVTKGMRHTLKVTGINSNSTVKYTSSRPKIASVNSKGIVRTKGVGFAPIRIEADGAVFIASINVGKKNGVKAVNNALKAEGAKYSQARRMSKGYYDCSSLVWRSYAPVGMNFGDRHYAPVAANEARYCADHKKTLPKSYLNKLDKLLPGDLFFFRGPNNGRYKNIYHVAIYLGQEGYGGYTFGRIIHASGVVVSVNYIYNQDNIVVIGRPFK